MCLLVACFVVKVNLLFVQKNFFSWGDICQLAPPWFWCMWLLRFPQFVRLFLQTKQGGDSCHLLLHGAGACVCCSLHSLSGCFHINGRDTELVVKVSLSEGLILLYCLLFWCCVFAEGFWGWKLQVVRLTIKQFPPLVALKCVVVVVVALEAFSPRVAPLPPCFPSPPSPPGSTCRLSGHHLPPGWLVRWYGVGGTSLCLCLFLMCGVEAGNMG